MKNWLFDWSEELGGGKESANPMIGALLTVYFWRFCLVTLEKCRYRSEIPRNVHYFNLVKILCHIYAVELSSL